MHCSPQGPELCFYFMVPLLFGNANLHITLPLCTFYQELFLSLFIHHVTSRTRKSFWSCDWSCDCLNSGTVKRTSYNAFWGGIIHSCHSWWSRIQIHFTLYCFISWLVHFSRIVSRNSRIHQFQGNFAKFEIDSLWKIFTGD